MTKIETGDKVTVRGKKGTVLKTRETATGRQYLVECMTPVRYWEYEHEVHASQETRFKVGDQVEVDYLNCPWHGKCGTVIAVTGHTAARPPRYKIMLDIGEHIEFYEDSVRPVEVGLKPLACKKCGGIPEEEKEIDIYGIRYALWCPRCNVKTSKYTMWSFAVRVWNSVWGKSNNNDNDNDNDEVVSGLDRIRRWGTKSLLLTFANDTVKAFAQEMQDWLGDAYDDLYFSYYSEAPICSLFYKGRMCVIISAKSPTSNYRYQRGASGFLKCGDNKGLGDWINDVDAGRICYWWDQ